MHSVLVKLSSVHVLVGVVVGALAMLEIIFPVAFVYIAIGIGEHSIAVFAVVLVVADVLPAVVSLVYTQTIPLVRAPVSPVPIAIVVVENTLSLLEVLLP